jgi:hypothetical protein
VPSLGVGFKRLRPYAATEWPLQNSMRIVLGTNSLPPFQGCSWFGSFLLGLKPQAQSFNPFDIVQERFPNPRLQRRSSVRNQPASRLEFADLLPGNSPCGASSSIHSIFEIFTGRTGATELRPDLSKSASAYAPSSVFFRRQRHSKPSFACEIYFILLSIRNQTKSFV